jgi:hypothetical protein
MKRNLFFSILVLAGFTACSPTQVVSSWRDPATTVKNPQAHKIVVGALIWDQGVRRQVEDYMASLYPGSATQSYLLFGGDSLLTRGEGFYNQRLLNEGYDGIVLMRQVSENTTQHYVPGQPPSFQTTWGGYWGGGWGGNYATTWYNPGTPGYVHRDWTWYVQVNAYSLPQNKLVWSGNTKTTDPGGRVPLFEDVCNAVHKQMKKDGFLN